MLVSVCDRLIIQFDKLLFFYPVSIKVSSLLVTLKTLFDLIYSTFYHRGANKRWVMSSVSECVAFQMINLRCQKVSQRMLM